MGEFDLIAAHLAPLAGAGSYGLKDDAARAFGRVLTKDVLVEGVHFLPTDPLDLVARKALRVNMSDLIAKAAKPQSYMMGLVWPPEKDEQAFATFAEGLAVEHQAHALELLGGDTTAGERLMISITMIGVPLTKKPLLRSGAEAGDVLVVTGRIGEGLLGLEAARNDPPRDDKAALPYRLPSPPFDHLDFIAVHAKASLDISDGLMADAGHLAEASGVHLTLNAEAIPLPAVPSQHCLKALVTAGDDYQTLFLVAPSAAEAVRSQSGLTVIGEARPPDANGPRAELTTAEGKAISLSRPGWDHFQP